MSEAGETEMRGRKKGGRNTKTRVIGPHVFRATAYEKRQKSELRSFPFRGGGRQEPSYQYCLSPAELQSYFVVAVNGADDSREDLRAR